MIPETVVGIISPGSLPNQSDACTHHTYPKEEINLLTKKLQQNGYKIYAFGKIAHGKMNPECGFDYYNKQLIYLEENMKNFLNRTNIEGPICIMIGDRRPHVPWTEKNIYNPETVDLPEYFIDTKQTREHRARYYSDISGFDKTLGGILDFLEDSKYKYAVSARIDPLNNFENLIRAFEKLKNDNVDFRCVIFGRGVEKETIHAKIDELNLGSSIYLIGNVNNAASYYHFFDLLIHPAFHAGFSNSVAEAIQSEINVVIGRIGDTADLFDESGLILKNFDHNAIYESIKYFNRMTLQEKQNNVLLSKTNLINLLDNNEAIKKWKLLIE